jgi:DNA-binding transcriptional LysR family regulator
MWNEHHIFVVCAALGSFSRAAGELEMQVSSVSRAITRLEEHLGIRLFERSQRSLLLTPAGEALRDEITPHMQAVAEASAKVKLANERAEGLLRIAAPHEFVGAYVEPVVERMLADGLDIRFELESTARLPDPVADKVDLFFSHRREEVNNDNLVCSFLHDVSQGLYAAPALIVRNGAPTLPADLAAWPCLVRPGEKAWHFQDRENRNFDVEIGGSIAATPSLLRLNFAARGHGAVLATRNACEPFVRDGRLVPMLRDFMPQPLSAWVFVPARRLSSRASRMFVAYVRDELARA